MILRELNQGSCKTYLVADGGEAALVDPILGKVDHYLAVLASEGLSLKYILDTHTHADHLSGAAALARATAAPYVMSAASPAAHAGVRVREGDALAVGRVQMTFIESPGHTEDSLMVRIGSQDGSTGGSDKLLTGDALFIGAGGAGRTDLRGGDAAQHFDSLRKLAGLPGELEIYPGHDYHGNQHSTLAQERAKNPRLAAVANQSRQAYAQALNDLKLPPAAWMEKVLDANIAGTTDGAAVVIPLDAPTCEVGGTAAQVGAGNDISVATVFPFEVSERLASGETLLLLDVREAPEWNDPLGHIAGARLVPLSTLPAGAADLPRDREVVTICRSGKRSATAARALTAAGFEKVSSMTGGMMAWNDAELAVERE